MALSPVVVAAMKAIAENTKNRGEVRAELMPNGLVRVDDRRSGLVATWDAQTGELHSGVRSMAPESMLNEFTTRNWRNELLRQAGANADIGFKTPTGTRGSQGFPLVNVMRGGPGFSLATGTRGGPGFDLANSTVGHPALVQALLSKLAGGTTSSLPLQPYGSPAGPQTALMNQLRM